MKNINFKIKILVFLVSMLLKQFFLMILNGFHSWFSSCHSNIAATNIAMLVLEKAGFSNFISDGMLTSTLHSIS